MPWRTRLTGAGGGAALILGLNTLRIGTLGRASASPAWFTTLHLYLWPGVLTLAVAAYVFAWMRLADRRQTVHEARDPQGSARYDDVVLARPAPTRRFVGLALIFLLLFVAASPLYLASPLVAALAASIAGAAAIILDAVGVHAHADGQVLWTSHGGFFVTQECIATPLLPVYLAAIGAYAGTWRRVILGVVATLPLFITLDIVRLLVVALPNVVVSPLVAVHAFYQLLVGAVLVCLAARWRYRGLAAIGHTLLAVIVAIVFVQVLGRFYTSLLTDLVGAPLEDPQGAMALLPPFQVGLYLALWIVACLPYGWRRFLVGLAGLALTQTAGLLALHALTTHVGLIVHVRDVRGWALAGPLVMLGLVVHGARPRR